jgi:hypothetical protein
LPEQVGMQGRGRLASATDSAVSSSACPPVLPVNRAAPAVAAVEEPSPADRANAERVRHDGIERRPVAGRGSFGAVGHPRELDI